MDRAKTFRSIDTYMNIFRLGLILLFWASISGASLAFVFLKTEKLIEKTKEEKIFRLQKEFLTFADKFKEINGGDIKIGYDKQGRELGAIVLVEEKGYSGVIEMLVGIDVSGKIVGVRIIKETETPGLGKKISGKEFLMQFYGKNKGGIELKKDNPNGNIDAITGATISSRAVKKGIEKALSKLSDKNAGKEIAEE